MKNSTLKTLQDTNLADNGSYTITAARLREFTTELVKHSGGFVSYNNANSTPQNLSSGVATQLTFDTSGNNNLLTYIPYYIEVPLLASNAIQINGIADGSVINGRFLCNLTTNSNNTEIKIEARFKNSEGDVVFTYPFANVAFKNSGSHTISSTGLFYVDPTLQDGTIEFYITADHSTSALWSSLMLDIR